MATHKVIVERGCAPIGKGPWQQSIPTHQARCECGWRGPRRAAAWEAHDDGTRHRNGDYGQLPVWRRK